MKKFQLAVQDIEYVLIMGQLFKLGDDGILKCYILNHESQNLCGNSTSMSWEDMLAEKLHDKRSYKHSYGVERYLDMLRNTIENVMYTI